MMSQWRATVETGPHFYAPEPGIAIRHNCLDHYSDLNTHFEGVETIC